MAMGRQGKRLPTRTVVKRTVPRFSPLVIEGRKLGCYTLRGKLAPPPNNLPSEFQIFSDKWQIFYHTKIFASRDKDDRLLGLSHAYERMVLIDPDQPRHELVDTLIHELTHSILSYGRAQNRLVHGMSDELEETICDLFARAVSTLSV